MAWNPEPQIAALREFSRRFDRPMVVAWSIDTFGKNKGLCAVAARFGGTMAKLINSGALAPATGPKAEGFQSACWVLDRARLGDDTDLAGMPELARADDLLIMRALLAGTITWDATAGEIRMGAARHRTMVDHRGVPELTPYLRQALTFMHG